MQIPGFGSFRQLLTAPGPDLSGISRQGEVGIARLRIRILIGLSIVPPLLWLHDDGSARALVGGVLLLIALPAALAFYRAAHRDRWIQRTAWVSSLFDISCVSLAILGNMMANSAEEGLRSLILFSLYFVFLAATSLRYDPRICLVTGAAAIAQYAALTAAGWWFWEAATPMAASDYGGLNAGTLIARCLTLLAASALAALSVTQTLNLLRAAVRDPLTSLYNRRFFDEHLRAVAERAARAGRPYSIAVLDLDGFKAYNDRYGHGVGDRALAAVGDALRHGFRATDIAARLGGEEFGILLPDCHPQEAAGRLDTFRVLLAGPGSAALPETLRFSAGVAGSEEAGSDPEAVGDLADRRMYAGKQAGGDRIVTGDDVAAHRPA